ncbi:DUF5107 domain-containing protein [Allofournierella sp.]|uniref:DUF5107 domain-containing protein n=1 Tax=Allofournierella sp. TaxID=1940256 RepID=UPI003AB3DDB0
MMEPSLTFSSLDTLIGDFGPAATIPDLLGEINVQNRTRFDLDDDDELFEGYGQRRTSFPYPQRNCYTRAVHAGKVKTAVLENDYIQATFLPEFGGRLWKLVDKSTGRDLLYTNDVIRPSNLALCNAWFSGGVEWNIGVIGHSPHTAEPLFTATLRGPGNAPMLRMYEYERVRGVTYQMDFWLGADDCFLNCRIRIDNSSSDTVPMYWWSNIAVPEHKGGRIAVNAKEAYTNGAESVYKTALPQADGLDVTRYNDIPLSDDYFFNIPKTAEKYILHVDAAGYGLMQLSTERLRGRKLFTWGHSDGSARWQEFLTENGGPYIEIQAGLGKTQFGCVPMPAHTAWEWLEQYGPVQLAKEQILLPFDAFIAQATELVAQEMEKRHPQRVLADTKALAKTPGTVVQHGSSFGALANVCRESQGEGRLPPWLDFGACDEKTHRWEQFVRTGLLEAPCPEQAPDAFMIDDCFFGLLQAAAACEEKANWYVLYQLGLGWFVRGDMQRAENCLVHSLAMADSAWARHALAAVYLGGQRPALAAKQAAQGLALRQTDLSYCKEACRILLQARACSELAVLYPCLPQQIQEDTRIRFDYILALKVLGRYEEAFALLTQDGGLELADIREGEALVDELYCELYEKVYDRKTGIPHRFHFRTHDPKISEKSFATKA